MEGAEAQASAGMAWHTDAHACCPACFTSRGCDAIKNIPIDVILRCAGLFPRSGCRRAREKMRTGEKLELFDGKGIIELLSKYHGEAPLPFCPNRKK
jgi:hypothetical protein